MWLAEVQVLEAHPEGFSTLPRSCLPRSPDPSEPALPPSHSFQCCVAPTSSAVMLMQIGREGRPELGRPLRAFLYIKN